MSVSKKQFKAKCRAVIYRFFKDFSSRMVGSEYKAITKFFKNEKPNKKRKKTVQAYSRQPHQKKITCVINFIIPQFVKHYIINFCARLFKAKQKFINKLVFNLIGKKVFNGCRAKKVRRKKRKALKIFKK